MGALGPAMSLRENLAVNLRRLCAQHGSVAAVCREMGVNRQQFDRYLTLDALPNKATTARICSYFNIEEAELYRNPADGEISARPRAAGRSARLGEGIIATRIFAAPQPTIQPGFYQTYFSIPNQSDEILCAITVIRAEEDRTTFRRLTGLAESKGSTWSYFVGDHEGVILERLNWFYFMGLNRRGTQEPTFLAVHWGPFSPDPLLCGHALIVTPSGPSVTTVVMRAVPKGVSLKAALRLAKVYKTSDPAIGQLIGLALKQQFMPMPKF
jgi:transcriptional regulator with XRE-family HTH domain